MAQPNCHLTWEIYLLISHPIWLWLHSILNSAQMLCLSAGHNCQTSFSQLRWKSHQVLHVQNHSPKQVLPDRLRILLRTRLYRKNRYKTGPVTPSVFFYFGDTGLFLEAGA